MVSRRRALFASTTGTPKDANNLRPEVLEQEAKEADVARAPSTPACRSVRASHRQRCRRRCVTVRGSLRRS